MSKKYHELVHAQVTHKNLSDLARSECPNTFFLVTVTKDVVVVTATFVRGATLSGHIALNHKYVLLRHFVCAKRIVTSQQGVF